MSASKIRTSSHYESKPKHCSAILRRQLSQFAVAKRIASNRKGWPKDTEWADPFALHEVIRPTTHQGRQSSKTIAAAFHEARKARASK